MSTKPQADLPDRPRRAAQAEPATVLVVPRQTPATIAERVRIREELHDARAVTVKGKPARRR